MPYTRPNLGHSPARFVWTRQKLIIPIVTTYPKLHTIPSYALKTYSQTFLFLPRLSSQAAITSARLLPVHSNTERSLPKAVHLHQRNNRTDGEERKETLTKSCISLSSHSSAPPSIFPSIPLVQFHRPDTHHGKSNLRGLVDGQCTVKNRSNEPFRVKYLLGRRS